MNTNKQQKAEAEQKAFRFFLWGTVLAMLPIPILSAVTMLAGRIVLYMGASKMQSDDGSMFDKMKKFMLASSVIYLVNYLGVLLLFEFSETAAAYFSLIAQTADYASFTAGIIFMGFGLMEIMGNYGKVGKNLLYLPSLAYAFTFPLGCAFQFFGLGDNQAVTIGLNLVWIGAALWLWISIYNMLKAIEQAKAARTGKGGNRK